MQSPAFADVFTEPEQFPASRMLDVEGLVNERLLLEIGVEAAIPEGGLDVVIVDR